MKIRKSFNFDESQNSYLGEYEEPVLCPLCKHALKPQELGIFSYKDSEGTGFISSLYLCRHCFQTFAALHRCTLTKSPVPGRTNSYVAVLQYVEPNRYTAEQFDGGILTLSPQFVKIYNQALAAESTGLDEIAGLGYRKAMEFLVKDFCIHLNPDDEEKIKALPLGRCITDYVKNEQIQTLATRAAWIGNDEAHYIRKQEGRDVSDMKAFIKATVYFVGMVLITEDAASMSPA